MELKSKKEMYERAIFNVQKQIEAWDDLDTSDKNSNGDQE